MPTDDLNLNLEGTLIPPSGGVEDSQAATPAVPAATVTAQPQATPSAATPAAGEASLGASAQAPASLPPNLLARAQQAGLPLDGINDTESLAQAILDQFIQSQPYAQYGRTALSTQQGGQGQSNGNADQQGGTTVDDEFDEDKYFSEVWTVPQLSSGAQWALDHGAFTTDDNGFIVPKAGLEQAALPYIKEINDYQQSKAALNETFANNPVRFMAEKLLPYFEHKFSGKFSEQTEQRFQQFEHQNFEDKFRDQNAKWLYTADAKAFTPDGLRFVEEVKAIRAELKEMGVQKDPSPEYLAKQAMLRAGINPNQQQAAPAPAAPPAQANNGKLRDEQGRFLPAGTPAPAPSKQESFIDNAKRLAAANSNQAGYADSGSDFIPANEGELENMFTQAYRKASAGVA